MNAKWKSKWKWLFMVVLALALIGGALALNSGSATMGKGETCYHRVAEAMHNGGNITVLEAEEAGGMCIKGPPSRSVTAAANEAVDAAARIQSAVPGG